MKIVVAGASGMVGTALGPELRAAGHDVHRLVRRTAVAADEIAWDPATGQLELAALEGADAVVNLAGENVGAGRWTAARRERILRSRTDTTRTLVTTMARLGRKPAVFISASATGFYGDRGDEELTERSAIGHGFLPEVCLAWETHAEGAARAGIRTVLLRFGVVLGRGGALAKMLPLFRLGLGGRMGSGRQWTPWVSVADAVGVIAAAIAEPKWQGPLNVVGPEPVTNADFTAALAHVLRRPRLLPAPAWGLQLVFGRMAKETILASVRARPEKLQKGGYTFRHADLETALRVAIGR